ncbi:MAG: glycosyltransferase family 4 protein [Planctomycetota bacterium]
MYFLILLAAAFALAFAVSAIACKLIVGISTHIGFVDRPAAHKQHGRIVPYGGGVGLWAGFFAGFTALTLLAGYYYVSFVNWDSEPPPTPLIDQDFQGVAWQLNVQLQSPPKARDEGIRLGSLTLCIFLLATLLLVLGLRDDRKPMGPFVKLAAQLLCAAAAVAIGVRGGFLIDRFGWWGEIAAWLISAGWIVFITNSFNLLDNTDGLAAGVAAIAALCLCLIAYLTDQVAMGALMAVLAGACTGFLLLNRHPAKLFMGDAGSLFIGFLFGCFTITFTYYHLDPQPGSHALVPGAGSPLSLLIPPLLMALPLYDTFSVIYIRVREGRSIFVGDRRHFSHRLLDLGLSVRKTIGVIYLAELAMGLGATLLIFLPFSAGLLVVGQGLIVFTIITLLEHAGRQKHRALLEQQTAADAAAPQGAAAPDDVPTASRPSEPPELPPPA